MGHSTNVSWFFVVAAGLREVVWASGLKYEEVPAWLVVVSLILTFDLLVRAAKRLPVGTTYAVFAGIGTVGTVVVESVVSGTIIPPAKILIILALLACVVGLKLTGEEVAE